MGINFLDFAAEYFNVPRRTISRKTKLQSLARYHHDLINFSFEVEKFYAVEFDTDEMSKIRTLGDYITVIEEKSGPAYQKAA